MWREPLPKPRRHIFDRRILQSHDIIEIRVIEQRDERFHGRADLGVIVNPAAPVIDFAFDRYLHFEAVSMHLATLVPLRRRREGLSGFEGKIFREAGAHRDAKIASERAPVIQDAIDRDPTMRYYPRHAK
jgi:hypothetical protein